MSTNKINNTNERFVPTAPTDSRKTVMAGIAVVLVAFGGFLSWASIAPLASAVIASGVVKVDSSRKLIQHLEGGIVKEILVKNGDHVNSGDILLRLDATRAGASLSTLRTGYETALAQQARLLAERDGRSEIEFPPELIERATEVNVSETMQAQQILFKARNESLQGQFNILDQQVTHKQKSIEGLTAQKKSKDKRIEIARAELVGLKELYKKKLIGRTRLLDVERELAEVEGERGELISEIAAEKTAIAEKKLEKFQVEKALHEQITTELREVQSEVFDLADRLGAARHVVSQTEIRSPVAGVVVGKDINTIGGIIRPGETLLEIVPALDRLIIEARIPPEEIDRVEVGLPSGIKFTAFNQRTVPEINGNVVYVSADILEDDKTGELYFLGRVEVPDVELKRLGDSKLQPGMFADVFIRTGERTFAEYLVQPLSDSIRKAWSED